MKDNPSVSVIIPVYKAEKNLHRCVDSFLKQTFSNFEVLLIDDGSPDNSGKICDAYSVQDKRIKAFHKTNGGVSSARQYGLDHAEGEYVIHADPDDWVEPTMLEELYQNAIQNNADMVICDFYKNIGNKQFYIKQQPSQLNHKVVQAELFKHLHGSCWNKLVKKTVIKNHNIKFQPDLSLCEDLYFNCSLLKHNIKVAYLSKAFYHYDISTNQNSIVKTYTKATYDYDVYLLNKFSKLLEDSTEIQKLSNAYFSYFIIERAFISGVFSSYEFKEKCRPYRKYIFFKGKRKKFSWLIYIAYITTYSIIYRLYSIYKNICAKSN